MTPEAQHWQQFIQSLTDRRQEIVKKANLPTTSHRDAHDMIPAAPASIVEPPPVPAPGKSPILCIDPGAGGGYAVQPPYGMVEASPMPDGMTAQIDAIRAIAANFKNLKAVVEKVGFHRPGNSATASCKFARHVGHIEAALYTCGIPFVEVTPHKWMAAIGTMPADKKARKNFIKEEMARRFPHLKVTLGVADALGILCWARNQS